MISVIIPAHNRSTYLDRTLQSVASQKNIEFEIILIDDNSSEDIKPIAARYKCVYEKNTENKGPQYCRNRGVALARFPYIAFLDSDDVWHRDNKLECQLEILLNHRDVTLVYAPLQYIDDSDNILQGTSGSGGIRFIDSPLSSMLNKDFIGTYSSVMMRKKDFLAVGGCDENLPARQDWDLWIRLAAHGDIVQDGRTSISYRMHPSQISSSGEKKLLGYMCVLEKNFDRYHLNLKNKAAYYKNLLKAALLVGFIGGGDQNQLPDTDKRLVRCLSKLSLIHKIPLAGNMFTKILKNSYLFKGVRIK